MLIHIAALFDKRWVRHVKLHGNFLSLVIFRCYGNGMLTKYFLQRVFRNGGRDFVRSRRPLFIHFPFCIVGAISDDDLGEVGNATDLFRLNVDDFKRASDDKVPGQERSLATGRFVSRDAVHDESGTISDCLV